MLIELLFYLKSINQHTIFVGVHKKEIVRSIPSKVPSVDDTLESYRLRNVSRQRIKGTIDNPIFISYHKAIATVRGSAGGC